MSHFLEGAGIEAGCSLCRFLMDVPKDLLSLKYAMLGSVCVLDSCGQPCRERVRQIHMESSLTKTLEEMLLYEIHILNIF